MKLSKKNAYNSQKRDNKSALSIMIACDYNYFISRYCLGDINYKINHKSYVKAIANNDKNLINYYL